ncbi:MAG: hypothetical protein FD153_1706 [Rhodospirillaceae bacterium]|nr:MAG: hypothetical protein FD153_1706 [Rhodospirillaceae bacterium]
MVLHHIEDMDHRLTAFYTRLSSRFVLALVLAIGAWVLGALQVYAAAYFLGTPLDLADAWIVEAMVQMVRAGTFFIPASVGAQEGAFLIVFTALSIPAPTAMAVALLRRVQEIVWVVFGMLLGADYLVRMKALQTAKLPEKNDADPAVARGAGVSRNQGIGLGPTNGYGRSGTPTCQHRSGHDGWPEPGRQTIPSWIFPPDH